MTKLEQLIKELCPDGVKYKALGDVVEILDNQRKPVTKKDRQSGIYPYYGANGIQDYVNDYIFDGTFLLMGEDGSVINKDNTPVLTWATGKIWVNNHAHIMSEKNDIALLRYIYFYLSTLDVSQYVRGTPPKINQQQLRSIRVPLPPLPVQREIVRILDNFTELTAELTAELAARKKQYEYYRDFLFNFENTVHWLPLGQIADIGTGSSNTNEELEVGEYPFFVRSQEVRRKDTFEYDETAIITSGDGVGVGKIFHFVEGKYALHQRAYRIHIRDERVLPKYYFYYMRSAFLPYIQRNAVNSSVTSIRRRMLDEFPVPIPSISEQALIVDILDRFDKLCNDISEGLPAEIEARRKQYEYYRDKLLTFKEAGA